MKRLILLCELLLISLLALSANQSYGLEIKAASTLSIQSSTNVTNVRNQVSIAGYLSPAHNGAPIALYRRILGTSSYLAVKYTSANLSGNYTFNIRPFSSANYKVGWAGDGDHDPAESSTIRIQVRPALSIYSKNKAAVHKRILISGSVSPRHNKKTVWLQQYIGKRWRNIKQTYSNVDSKYKFKIRLNYLKTYKFRTTFSDVDHARVYSRAKKIKVYWPNPFGISSRFPKYIVIVRNQYRLYYIIRGNIEKTFPVVVGKPSTRTPPASWKIGEKNPRGWGSVQGPLVMRLYRSSGSGYYWTRYGIHGTNQEELLSRYPRGYSHGCIRMYNRQILWLSARVPVGTRVKTI